MKDVRRRLLAWYDAHARDLPWRGQGRTPYRVLVSEVMLQQTQVATVVPYFNRFMAALPTLESLAAADEQRVLRLWQGLGYYSRAQNLHRAAKAVAEVHNGQIPRSLEALRALPGIGRYTAGAIASIAWGERAAVVDGNVARVLCRLELIRGDPRSPPTQRRLWKRALDLLPPTRCGDFNSALMELGATICTPRNPQCPRCPLRGQCRARAAGKQAYVPPPAVRKPTPLLRRDVFVIRDSRGRFLVEQRPPTGRWAGMWQFITRPRGTAPPLTATMPVLVATLRHALTHRRYIFRVFQCASRSPAPPPARWATAAQLEELPMPRAHLRIWQMITAGAASATGA